MPTLFPKLRRVHRFAVLAIVPATLLSAGCKTWYKPGSGDDEFAEQERRCEQQATDASGTSLDECLHFSGWSATDLSVTADDPADSDDLD